MSSSDLSKVDDLKLEDDYEIYKLGDFALKSGGEIPDAFIAYKTLGDPSLPAIIYPTWYSGSTFPFPPIPSSNTNPPSQQYPTTSGSQAVTKPSTLRNSTSSSPRSSATANPPRPPTPLPYAPSLTSSSTTTSAPNTPS
jgi:hypothetical protein